MNNTHLQTPPCARRLLTLFASLLATSLTVTAAMPADSTRAQVLRAGAPLLFEKNTGQTDADVRFLSRGGRSTLFLTPAGSTLVVRSGDTAAALRMQLVGANAEPKMEGLDPLAGTMNSFIGSDPAQWRTQIPTYARAAYREVWPGIDLVYHGQQGKLEYDFVIAPGSDPSAIRMQFAGAEKIEVDARGDLVLHIAGGTVRQLAPVTYQQTAEGRREIASRYVLHGAEEVGFEVAAYDAALPLTIDPILWYSTYWGGEGTDEVIAMAVDTNGNSYVTGTTSSTIFPRTTGAFDITLNGGDDISVSKFGPTTTAAQTPAVLYSTYLGGSGREFAGDIAADSAGRAYLVGSTESANFPTVAAFQSSLRGTRDAFVAKLNATGSALDFSTYLGGNGDEVGRGIAVRGTQVHVTGASSSSITFPVNGPYQRFGAGNYDAFVAKFTAAGSALIYSTLFGGSVSSDQGNAIAVDPFGIMYVTGRISGDTENDFPVKSPPGQSLPPFQSTSQGQDDGFVAKFDPAATGEASLIYSTKLGGSGGESGLGIAVDASQRAYVTGGTNSPNFPLKLSARNAVVSTDVFVTKFNADGTAVFYSILIGGENSESGNDIALDVSGNAWVVGDTGSPDFPFSADRLQEPGGGGSDAFVTQIVQKTITFNGRVFVSNFGAGFSTPFGGNQGEDGNTIVVDSANNVHFAGATSSGFGSGFIVQNAPLPFAVGGREGYVVKLGRVDRAPVVQCSVATAQLWPPNSRLVNVGLQVTAADDNDPAPAIDVTVFSDETDVDTGGGAVVSPDAIGWAAGTLQLRAERRGEGDGRVYLIIVRAADSAGNVSNACCTVTVPHGQSAKAKASAAAQAECAGSGGAPATYFLLTPVPTNGARR